MVRHSPLLDFGPVPAARHLVPQYIFIRGQVMIDVFQSCWCRMEAQLPDLRLHFSSTSLLPAVH